MSFFRFPISVVYRNAFLLEFDKKQQEQWGIFLKDKSVHNRVRKLISELAGQQLHDQEVLENQTG